MSTINPADTNLATSSFPQEVHKRSVWLNRIIEKLDKAMINVEENLKTLRVTDTISSIFT